MTGYASGRTTFPLKVLNFSPFCALDSANQIVENFDYNSELVKTYV